ncbi:V-type ATP synthase subunit I [Odoribacter lunatus]|uniref:V-type ATP synthase subunit I n=1 Tax=Odoribacter lunatus TaxID=2941335 RepID=UPI0020414AB6|nr:V-type ATPase 116kDa subunit family protein [Odoribacter lunatus]
MRKLSLLVFYKDYQNFLDELRERGVVHIYENKQRAAENETLQAKLYQIRRVNEMIRLLENRSVEENGVKVDRVGEDLLVYLEEQYHRQEQIISQLEILEKDLVLYEPWGNFSRERIAELVKVGWELRFFTVSDRKYLLEWEEQFNSMVINEQQGQKYFVTVTPQDQREKPDADTFVFPQESEECIRGTIEQLKNELSQISVHLDEITGEAIRNLKYYRETIGEVTDFLKVDTGSQMLIEDKVIALEGWIPVDCEVEMKKFLQGCEVYYEFSTPTPDEDVPVLLKNNRFTKLFEPITEMFALPNYHELDPTPFFAPFFMLFFGLCMGDGGYGLLIWAVCFGLLKKASPAMKGYLKLGEYLGIATIIVGILTGSFFGIALESVEWTWLKGIKEYFVTEANYGKYLNGYNPMMVVAIIIGIIQILFGMCLSAVKMAKQFGFRYAMSTIGWVVVLIMAGITWGLPLCGGILPRFLLYIFYGIMAVCVFAIVFMNSPGKGVLTNFGSALWGTYNMATGLLGDTLSYIRLFALGLTGSILGGVFNTLAFDLTVSLPVVLRFIAILLILLAGHTINFGLCMIGAFVHPMRLTFVEFYKNASFEGGGKKYSPFCRRVVTEK